MRNTTSSTTMPGSDGTAYSTNSPPDTSPRQTLTRTSPGVAGAVVVIRRPAWPAPWSSFVARRHRRPRDDGHLARGLVLADQFPQPGRRFWDGLGRQHEPAVAPAGDNV